MYRSGHNAASSFSFYSAATTTNISSNGYGYGYGNSNNNNESNGSSSGRRSSSRPRTSSADPQAGRPSLDYRATTADDVPVPQQQQQQQRPNVLTKERRLLSRRPSFSRHRRSRSTSSAAAADQDGSSSSAAFVTDDAVPPALPHFALSPNLSGQQQAGFQTSAAAGGRNKQQQQPPASVVVSPPPPSTGAIDSFSRMLSRTAPSPGASYAPSAVMYGGQLAPPPAMMGGGAGNSEGSYVFQLIHDTANKRISTLDYLRKAHEGRVYWFNTLLFDKPDLQRMPYFSDPRKLARRATNYLLLGLSLPAVVDLNSSSAVELLRALSALLSEFESFQQLHSEAGGAPSSLSRARLPHMFRRTAQGGKARRTSGAAEMAGPSYSLDGGADDGAAAAVGGALLSSGVGVGGGGAFSPSDGGRSSVMNFAASETDLLPGEEYAHLLTPSLPFDPDFFETFATLCDVLIDCVYARLLALMPTPRECGGPAAELFTKVDGKIRKLVVQNVVKEFEDASRGGLKTEVANVGKVVLGGLL